MHIQAIHIPTGKYTHKATPQVHSPIDRDTNEQLHHVRELGIYAVLHLADLRAPTILGIKTHHS